MIISYFGKQFFKVQYGDTVLAFNPISKDSKGKASRFGADIVLSTTNHEDYNGLDQVSHGETVPFPIKGPGDYEVKGIMVKGILNEGERDGKPYVNTIYSLTVDNINMCFLGALSSGKLSAEAREAIDDPDVVFVPLGANGTLSSSEAYKLAMSLEPRIIIPMDYEDDAPKDALKIFLKEGGQEKVDALDKLTIKRKDIESKEGEIVLLSHA
jgi:L-ascorbate metabolism protein UlaG (beta-lactamase superfamily)